MVKTKFETVTMHDGASVYTARFEPEGELKGVIQATHGFSEHVYRYQELGEFFANNGYAFVINDMRGFGKMPDKTLRQRKAAQGLIIDYNSILKDMVTIRGKIDKYYPNVPVVLYGYSLGGNVALNLLHKYKQCRYDKLILAAPWLQLYNQPSDFVIFGMKKQAILNPTLTFQTGLDTSRMARPVDGVEYDRSDDDYFHSRMSFKLFLRTDATGKHAIKNAKNFTIPTLLLVPGQDMIVCPNAMRKFHANSGGNVIIVEYPDAYHALHYDLVKHEFMERMLYFIANSA